MLFTTSWDDGYRLDLRIAELLSTYKFTGTFYVCPASQHGERMLSASEIRTLANRFEIGAHTLRHSRLSHIPLDRAQQEIIESKQWVEEITGKPCRMFCYPKGDRNDAVEKIVSKAGFIGARGIEEFAFSAKHPFALPTTLLITPFPTRRRWSKLWHPLDHFGPLRVRLGKIRALGLPFSSFRNWLSLAKALFANALHASAPFFHLWGHSAEIERYDLWGELEEFFRYAANERARLTAVTNGDLVEKLQLSERCAKATESRA